MNNPLSVPKKRICIIGGVAGGATVAAHLRRLSEEPEIIIFERDNEFAYATCGIPYAVGDEITSHDHLSGEDPHAFSQRFNITIRLNCELMGIDPDHHRIRISDTRDCQKTWWETYDELILATGAQPKIPDLPGIDLPGHFTVRNLDDMKRIEQWISTTSPRQAVILGGGYIGLEFCEQLKRRGMEITIVETQPFLMNYLDPEIAVLVHQELRKNGINLILGRQIKSFDLPRGSDFISQEGAPHGHQWQTVATLDDDTRIPADMVIIASGISPNVGLARQAGIAIGETGAIRVDKYLRTNKPNIWALGDVIELRNPLTNRPTTVPLAGPAHRQARVIANNITFPDSYVPYSGALGTSILRVFDSSVAQTGLSEKSLKKAALPYQSVILHGKTTSSYFPNSKPLTVKILFHPHGYLWGAQVFGFDGVDKRIDVLAMAIHTKATIGDLASVDLAYAPPFSSPNDPANQAGSLAWTVMNRMLQPISWDALPALFNRGVQVLDVRSPEAYSKGHFTKALNIPALHLRSALADGTFEQKFRDKNLDMLVYCDTGHASYEACRILNQHGYNTRWLSGGFRLVQMLIRETQSHEANQLLGLLEFPEGFEHRDTTTPAFSQTYSGKEK